MDALRVRTDCLAEMIKEAKEAAPLEACGILAGRDGVVTKVYAMKNVDVRPDVRYFMEPTEQLQTAKEMRSEGLKMLGIYHSHPLSPARPSAVDVTMAFYPDVAYVIVSLAMGGDAEVRTFRISGTGLETPNAEPKVEEMALETVNGG